MGVLIDLFDWQTLTRVVNKRLIPEPFVLSNVFPIKKLNDSHLINVYTYKSTDDISQLNFPKAEEPRIASKDTVDTTTVTLPRIYDTYPIDISEFETFRNEGNVYVIDSTQLENAAEENKLRLLDKMKNRILRKQEQMAVEALSTGKIVDSAIGVTWDFGFVDTTHLITLTGNDLWSDTTNSNPIENLKSWKTTILSKTGKPVKQCLMGTNAAKHFLAHPKVKAALDYNNYRIGSVDLTGIETGAAFPIARNFLGMDIYEYNQQYKTGGTATDMLSDTRVVLYAQSDSFELNFGPIKRFDDANRARIYKVEYLVFPVTNQRKTHLELDIESWSLPTIGDPDCVISAIVCA